MAPNVGRLIAQVFLDIPRGVQAELQGDGYGDHIFLLRVAEVTAAAHLEKELVDTLRLSGRGLAFARKVRAQLAAVVEQRVWPAFAARHGSAPGGKRSRDECDSAQAGSGADAGGQDGDCAGTRDRYIDRHRTASVPACPSLDARGSMAKGDEVDRVRQALAIGYAPRIAKRMPAHNGYRTITARKASVACDPPTLPFRGQVGVNACSMRASHFASSPARLCRHVLS